MKKINYKTASSIAEKYEKAMAHTFNDAGWQSARASLIRFVDGFSEANLPLHHKDILVADFQKLAKIYVTYVKSGIQTSHPDLHKKLKYLFNYDFDGIPNMQNEKIKRFFYDHSESFGISTCHYCDMAYINTYGGQDKIKDILNFLNTASFEALKRTLNYADSTIKKITNLRKSNFFSSKKDFDDRIKDRRISYKKIYHKIKQSNTYFTHFDLDHFLDKGRCPMVALSIFNLVPSCSVCNERIKHSYLPATLDVAQLCDFSPTCHNYKFENNVRITVETDTGLPFLDYVKNKDRCSIEFICTGRRHYERVVEFFRLRDRYQYHKIEALRLMDLRQRYEKMGNIEEIARLVYGNDDEKSIKLVRDDIFQTYFRSEHSRTFSKLYKDILSN